MKLLLLANFTSLESEESAASLAARQWDVLTYYKLHHPSYIGNNGRTPTQDMAHRWAGVEMVEGRVVVVHPDLNVDLLREVQGACRFLRVPMVRLADVPFLSTEDREWVDAHNCVHESPYAILGLPEMTAEQERAKVVYHLDDHAPSRMDAVLAEDEPRYNADHVVGNVATALRARLASAMQWLDRQLAGMKNPMVAAQQRRGPANYLEKQIPVSTTG